MRKPRLTDMKSYNKRGINIYQKKLTESSLKYL